MSLPDGRRKGTCSLWLKRSRPCGKKTGPRPLASTQSTGRRAGNWVLLSLVGLALASAALSVLLYIEPCGRPRHEISNQTITLAYNLSRPRAGDKKTTYDTHNTTTVVNVTTYENVSTLENARPRR